MKVLIVGCGAIGSAIGKKFLLYGHDVIITSRDTSDRVRRMLDYSRALGRVDHEFLDANDLEKTRMTLLSIAKRVGKLDVVIWSAGVVYPGEISDTPFQQALETFNVNFWGPYIMLMEAPQLMFPGGRMIFLTSSMAGRESPGFAAYAASKAALASLVSSVAVELISKGIKVYNICPGRVASPLRSKIAPHEDRSLILQPDGVADVVYFVASEAFGGLLSTYPIRVHGGPYR